MNSDFLKTIVGIIIFAIFIWVVISITNGRDYESSCPNADCYTDIWP